MYTQLHTRRAAPSARQRLRELALLEDDLQALGGVARALRVQRRTVPFGGEAVEEVHPLRLVALVVVEDDGDALAVGLSVDHFLAPVVELLLRGEVALADDPS